MTPPRIDSAKILLVDDDPAFRLAMGKALSRKGFQVVDLAGGAAAIAALQDEACDADLLLLDLQMPGVSGMEVLRRTPRRRPKVVVLTGHGTIPDAVEAMRLGAASFLLKPIDADELVPTLRQALLPRAAGLQPQDILIGESPATRRLRDLLSSLAAALDPVLLFGETGTGKEVAATYLHHYEGRSQSGAVVRSRAAQPFVAVNLACVPRELLESELFGHARGAFTGAERRKAGLFAEAGEGTLFLDELSELPLEHQPKLLRALETRSFRPVGETREEPLRARLVFATNRDLKAMVHKGLFREDLYYRLAVLPVVLPPLRERPGDIVPIASHWLNRLTSAHHADGPRLLSPDAQAALQAHDYPGNVRELVNVIRRVALFASGKVVEGDLVRRMLAEDPFRMLRSDTPAAPKALQPIALAPTALLGSRAVADEPLSLRELEIRHIERLLREHKNITMVAKILDIDRRTLQRKLRSLGIDWRDDG